MNKQIVRFSAPILAVLVVLSTLSWSVEKHLCMGNIIDIALFHHAEGCGMEQVAATCKIKTTDNHCCEDESFILEGQDDLNISCDEFKLTPQKFLETLIQPHFNLILIDSEEVVSDEIYPPPILFNDLHLLHEVFLI